MPRTASGASRKRGVSDGKECRVHIADGLKQDFAEGQREKADGPRPQGTDYGTFNFTRHYQHVLFCFQALSLDDT